MGKRGGNGEHPDVFNYDFGYAGNTSGVSLWDTLHSHYETFLDGTINTIPITDPLVFEHNYGDPSYNLPSSTMFAVEFLLYHNYKKNSDLLFSKKPWWANLWIIPGDWVLHKKSLPDDTLTNYFTLGIYDNSRPKTGEEINLMVNSAICLGAKGIMYYLKNSGYWDDVVNNCVRYPGLEFNDLSPLQGENLIYSNTIEGDYINVINDPNGFHRWFDSKYYDFETMGIDSNHIYIGLKSARAELMKKHKWITANEKELLDLRLMAWKGKGFTNWYLQEEGLPYSNMMYRYIDTIARTRYPFRLNWQGKPQYEDYDSTFTDISLFRLNGKDSTRYFALALLNRRTDPLIPIYSENDPTRLDFYPTASLDSLVRGPDSLNFAEYWWRRLGTREILLVFNYQWLPQVFPPSYELRVSEMGAHNVALNSNWWRKPRLYNLIDTVIFGDYYLPFRLLPGDSKLLNVQVVRLSVGSSECDPCALISSGALTVEYKKTDDCCWDVYIKNTSTCQNLLLPVSMQVSSPLGTDSTFMSVSNFVTDKVFTYEGFWTFNSIISDTLTKIGTICVPPFSLYQSKVYIGNLSGNDPWRCITENNESLSCPPTCCDLMSYTIFDGYITVNGDCCDTIRFHKPDSCLYYGIAHSYIYNNDQDTMVQSDGVQQTNEPVDVNNYLSVICSSYQLPGFHQFDFCDSLGNTICSKMIEVECDYSKKRSLEGIIDYILAKPNPANETTTVEYNLLAPGYIQLEMYDFSGNLLSTLDKGHKDKGISSVQIRTDQYKQGIYYLIIKSDQQYKNTILFILR